LARRTNSGRELAEQFDVQAVCPVATKKALQAIANNPSNDAAYWRVVKKNGELLAHFPSGVKGHAALLGKEGFVIDTSGQKPKVKNIERVNGD
jgi:hypothetical protein